MLFNEIKFRLRTIDSVLQQGWFDYIESLNEKQMLDEYTSQAYAEKHAIANVVRLTKVYQTGTSDRRNYFSLNKHFISRTTAKLNLGQLVLTAHMDILVVTAVNVSYDQMRKIKSNCDIIGVGAVKTLPSSRAEQVYVNCTFANSNKYYTYRMGEFCPALRRNDMVIVKGSTGYQPVRVVSTYVRKPDNIKKLSEVVCRIDELPTRKKELVDKLRQAHIIDYVTSFHRDIKSAINYTVNTDNGLEKAIKITSESFSILVDHMNEFLSSLKELKIIQMEESNIEESTNDDPCNCPKYDPDDDDCIGCPDRS